MSTYIEVTLFCDGPNCDERFGPYSTEREAKKAARKIGWYLPVHEIDIDACPMHNVRLDMAKRWAYANKVRADQGLEALNFVGAGR